MQHLFYHYTYNWVNPLHTDAYIVAINFVSNFTSISKWAAFATCEFVISSYNAMSFGGVINLLKCFDGYIAKNLHYR